MNDHTTYRVRGDDPLTFVISNFRSLEADLMTCLTFIPCTLENRQMFSPRFIPIMLESCSLIESICCRITTGTERYTLKSFSDRLERQLELEDATTIILTSPLQLLRSFLGWTKRPPVWWTAYNRLKHDRIRNYAAASLSNATLFATRSGLFATKSVTVAAHAIKTRVLQHLTLLRKVSKLARCSRRRRP